MYFPPCLQFSSVQLLLQFTCSTCGYFKYYKSGISCKILLFLCSLTSSATLQKDLYIKMRFLYVSGNKIYLSFEFLVFFSIRLFLHKTFAVSTNEIAYLVNYVYY